MSNQTMLSAGLRGTCNKVVFIGYFKQYQCELDMWGKLVVRNRFTRRYLKGYEGGKYYILTDFTGGFYIDGNYVPTAPNKVRWEYTRETLLDILDKQGITLAEAIASGLYLEPSNNNWFQELPQEINLDMMGDWYGEN